MQHTATHCNTCAIVTPTAAPTAEPTSSMRPTDQGMSHITHLYDSRHSHVNTQPNLLAASSPLPGHESSHTFIGITSQGSTCVWCLWQHMCMMSMSPITGTSYICVTSSHGMHLCDKKKKIVFGTLYICVTIVCDKLSRLDVCDHFCCTRYICETCLTNDNLCDKLTLAWQVTYTTQIYLMPL